MALFENTCRICNNIASKLFNIFETRLTEKLILVSDMLNQCGPVKPIKYGDSFPKQICFKCTERLKIAFQFLSDWKRSEAEFEVALKFENRRINLQNLPVRERSYAILALDNKEQPITTINSDEMTLVEVGNNANTKPVDNIHQKNVCCHLCNKLFFTRNAAKYHRRLFHRNTLKLSPN